MNRPLSCISQYLELNYEKEKMPILKKSRKKGDPLKVKKEIIKNFRHPIPASDDYGRPNFEEFLQMMLLELYELNKEIQKEFENPETMKKRVIHTLVSKDSELKKHAPYTDILDMSYVYMCVVGISPETFYVIHIKNDYMEENHLTVEELEAAAQLNTPLLLPLVNYECLDFDEYEPYLKNGMFFSNDTGQHGAAAVFYPDALDSYLQEHPDGYVVAIPFLNEMLIGTVASKEEVEEIKKIKKEEPITENFLSDSIYMVNRRTKALEIA